MRLLRWLLAPLSPLYGATVRARNRAFDAHPERAARLGVPVISVGNLSSGGTGKTPVTLHLAERLQAEGWTNIILSRGYGGRRKVDPMDVQPDSHPAETGDEPLMMARRLGENRVIVGRKRVSAGMRALARSPRLLLLDDGFQHRALHRDLDLLVLDGVRRWENGRMLPLGNLREPMESAKRAHALVVTRGARAPKEEIEAWWQRYGSGGPIIWIDFAIREVRQFPEGAPVSPAQVPGPLLAFCALGHPEAFYADLLVAGLAWIDTRSFPDHQPLGHAKLRALGREAQEAGAAGLICTEKDAIKFGRAYVEDLGLPLWVAQQDVLGAEPLVQFVTEQLDRVEQGKKQQSK